MKVLFSASLIFLVVQISTASVVLAQPPHRSAGQSRVQGLEKLDWCWPWQLKHGKCPTRSSTTPQTTSVEPFTTTDYPESTTDANTSESSAKQTTTLQTDTSTESTRASTLSHLESTTIYSSESTTGTVVSTTAGYVSSSTLDDSTTDESDPSSEPSTTTELPDGDESHLVFRVVSAITILTIAAVCVFAFYKIISRTHYQRLPSDSDSAV